MSRSVNRAEFSKQVSDEAALDRAIELVALFEGHVASVKASLTDLRCAHALDEFAEDCECWERRVYSCRELLDGTSSYPELLQFCLQRFISYIDGVELRPVDLVNAREIPGVKTSCVG